MTEPDPDAIHRRIEGLQVANALLEAVGRGADVESTLEEFGIDTHALVDRHGDDTRAIWEDVLTGLGVDGEAVRQFLAVLPEDTE